MFPLRNGMRIGFDVEVLITDGTIVRADLYLPDSGQPAPVIMTMGPYGKGSRFQDKPYTSRWERLSHRKTDPDRSLRWRPRHTHDEILPVEPGRIYPVDGEIWPTGIHLTGGPRSLSPARRPRLPPPQPAPRCRNPVPAQRCPRPTHRHADCDHHPAHRPQQRHHPACPDQPVMIATDNFQTPGPPQ